MNRKPLTETFRITDGRMPSTAADGDNGAFRVPFEGTELLVICSDGSEWDHVSVSLLNRDPKWREMCYIKSLFFGDDECVMQLHPPKADWINNHPHCLHLWRPQKSEIPRPPGITAGIKGLSPREARALSEATL